MNYNEQIREGKGFSTKIKKIAPISLITGLDTIFFKKELNNIATSYINDSHLIQNLKLKNSKLYQIIIQKIKLIYINHLILHYLLKNFQKEKKKNYLFQ